MGLLRILVGESNYRELLRLNLVKSAGVSLSQRAQRALPTRSSGGYGGVVVNEYGGHALNFKLQDQMKVYYCPPGGNDLDRDI